jgi:Predicted periplasmic lipoprotein (DUF2279)
MKYFILFFFFNILIINGLQSQSSLLEPSDTFNKKRFNTILIGGTVGYTGAVLVLNKVWYSEYPQSSFHLFDDVGEWENMDKYGHVLSAYVETKWAYSAYRWAGVKNRRAAWLGMLTGTVLQSTLEVMDGFSEQWGFSLADVAANTSGCALFGLQQAAWNEQRILLKVSNFPKNYSKEIVAGSTLSENSEAKRLYGDNYALTFFKDYNAINWWLSANPRSFMKNSNFPSWLNIAVGHSAENVFGAYGNPAGFPSRYRQYFLSFDIDLSKIKTKNRFLRSVLGALNFIKIPSPTLELNSQGKFKFYPIMF